MRLAYPRLLDVPTLPGPVAVVGDVHLNLGEGEVIEAFLGFLDRAATRARSVVLLGDLFHTWSGAAEADEFLPEVVLTRLRGLAARGVTLCFQAGNRDFLFPRGVDLDIDHWPQLVRMEWQARHVLFTHGDLLCTSDTGYQLLRLLLRRRSGDPRLWSSHIPLSWRRSVIRLLRHASTQETQKKSQAYMDIDYDAARAWLDHYDADVLVAGHVHTGVHRQLPAPEGAGAEKESFVLLDWEHGGSVIVLDEGGIQMVAPEDF